MIFAMSKQMLRRVLPEDQDMKNGCVFCGIVILLFIMVGCQARRAEHSCIVQDLLLNKDDFPTGTILNHVGSPVADLPPESAGRSASYNQDLIYAEVSRYRSPEDADVKFDELDQFLFIADKYSGPWNIPEEIVGFTLRANQFRYACGKSGNSYQCRMIGRYEEYIVFLFSYISNQGITIDRFQNLMVSFDNRMFQCLGEK
jgi:hypothetical protein